MRSTANCVSASAALGLVLAFGAAALAAPTAGLAVATSVVPAGGESQRSARTLYDEAQAAERRLHQSAARLAKKSEWVRVARLYRSVVIKYPQSGYCDDALYYEAELLREIDRRFKDEGAVQRALDSYLLLANGYPSSKWAVRARLNRGRIFFERLSDRKNASIELRKVTRDWPSAPESVEAQKLLDDMAPPRAATAPPAATGEDDTFPPGIVGVRNVRHWTGREYTRIVIDLDDEVKFREGRVRDPDRIYFDLLGARVTRDLATRSFPVEDGFLQQIRVGQNQTDVVRVVLDFQNISEYNVFSLPDPYRLVVDILGQKPTPSEKVVVARKTAPPKPSADGAPPPDPEASTPASEGSPVAAAGTGSADVGTSGTVDSGASATPTEVAEATPDVIRVPPVPRDGRYSLVQQLGLGAYRVVIDPGHGGHDPGTMNKRGLREKDIALDVAKRVRSLLERDGFEVLMTRDRDVFIPLEERTAIANSKEADLFVSIHVNAARSTRPRGTETYYLNLSTTPDAEEVAARENAVTTRRLGELQSLLQKVMNNSRIAESRELAGRVQTTMASDLFQSTKDPRNRGVKTAPFYVLLGAQMPSVLVELAYLTNRKDAELLDDAGFRQQAAESIARGIRVYQESLVKTTSADANGSRVAGRD